MSVPLPLLIFSTIVFVLLVISWWDRGREVQDLYGLIDKRDRFRDTLIREAEADRATIAELQREKFSAEIDRIGREQT